MNKNDVGRPRHGTWIDAFCRTYDLCTTHGMRYPYNEWCPACAQHSGESDMDGWISVQERLPPEAGIDVLVFCEDNRYLVAWVDIDGYWWSDCPDMREPTHWTPVPPRPDATPTDPVSLEKLAQVLAGTDEVSAQKR